MPALYPDNVTDTRAGRNQTHAMRPIVDPNARYVYTASDRMMAV